MTGSLKMHVVQYLDGQSAESEGGEVIANIIPLSKVKLPAGVEVSDILIPVGPPGKVQPRLVSDLPAGRYQVRVRMPSGTEMDQVIAIEEGEEAEIAFEAESSPFETLSWQAFAGGIAQQIERRLRRELQARQNPQERAPVQSHEDLQLIKGIGPAVESALNRIGIEQVGQLARLASPVLGMLSQSYLKRIDTSGWLEQAENLLKEREEAPEAEDNFSPPLPALPQPQARYFFRTEGENSQSDFLRVLARRLSENAQTRTDVFVNADALADEAGNSVAPPEDLKLRVQEGGDETLRVWGLMNTQRQEPRIIRRREGINRMYVVADDGMVQWLFCVPTPWPGLMNGQPVGIDVNFDRSIPEESGVSIVPRHARSASLLGFMREGDVRASRAILDSARSLLFEKVANPFAAAAGGCVLINELRWGGGIREERQPKGSSVRGAGMDGPWDQWLENLANWFPWLPDAKILLAWHILLSTTPKLTKKHRKMVRDLLLNAAEGGLPVYTASFRLLVDGLKFLKASEEGGPIITKRISDALNAAMSVSMRIDTRQVFLTVRLTPRDRIGLPL
ncbi:hypothetical protein [uncultured Roseobacter sp.]|uniref:hypothetical protein n=1 Tax=uncultured Roseobacter sp. TaxID=114847 RepID=UPI00263496C8|nr:hypothetical protein [uncultured Roseobacter sp.]